MPLLWAPRTKRDSGSYYEKSDQDDEKTSIKSHGKDRIKCCKERESRATSVPSKKQKWDKAGIPDGLP